MPVLGRKGVQDFFPPFSEAPLPDYLDSVYATTRTGQAFAIPDTTASDNWVVAGSRSEDGRPLLANDPHLGFSIPSVWYLAHLSFQDEDVVGGTLAGIPAIVAGRNRHVAWGETNTDPIRRISFLSGSTRITGANTRSRAVVSLLSKPASEIIKVRFGAGRRILCARPGMGPVMPEGSVFGRAAPDGYVYRFAWTALAAGRHHAGRVARDRSGKNSRTSKRPPCASSLPCRTLSMLTTLVRSG